MFLRKLIFVTSFHGFNCDTLLRGLAVLSHEYYGLQVDFKYILKLIARAHLRKRKQVEKKETKRGF